jgi:hypothetical protein
LTGLDWSVLQIKTKIVSSHTADSKPIKQEVNGTVILPPLVFPAPPAYFASPTVMMNRKSFFHHLHLFKLHLELERMLQNFF